MSHLSNSASGKPAGNPVVTLASRVNGRPRVLIVGGGFGGLHAAMGLAHMPVDVTVIDRRNHHIFQPLLYQVALAVLSPADIAQPIRTILHHNRNTQVLMDEVVGIDAAARTVSLSSGSRISYDYLVLATGATHSYFAHPEWAPLAPGLKTVEDATEIRRRVLLAFELAERQMVEHGWHPPLNFVVVGGGPTGVELAGAISDIAQLYMRHDFRHIDPSKSRVLLLEGSKRILSAYPPDLSASAEASLRKLGVEVHTDTQVTGIGPGYVEASSSSKEGHGRIDAAVTRSLLPEQDAQVTAPALIGALVESLLGPLAPIYEEPAAARTAVQNATVITLRALGIVDARARGLVAQTVLP